MQNLCRLFVEFKNGGCGLSLWFRQQLRHKKRSPNTVGAPAN